MYSNTKEETSGPSGRYGGRLNTPLQARHDELERMQEMLRSMPTGGRCAGGGLGIDGGPGDGGSRRAGGSGQVSVRGRPGHTAARHKEADEVSATTDGHRTAVLSKARHVFDEVMGGGGGGSSDAQSARLNGPEEVALMTNNTINDTKRRGGDGYGEAVLHTGPSRGGDLRSGVGEFAPMGFGADVMRPGDTGRCSHTAIGSRGAPSGGLHGQVRAARQQFDVMYDGDAHGDSGDDPIPSSGDALPPLARRDDPARPSRNPSATAEGMGNNISERKGPAASRYLLNELRTVCPLLSGSFACSEDDAVALLNSIGGGGADGGCGGRVNYGHDLLPNHHGSPAIGGIAGGASTSSGSAYHVAAMEDKCTVLEAEVRSLTQRLERRGDECDRLRDDVAEARQRLRALEASTKQQQTMMGQRREEARKQLLNEEGRTAKLTHQNKLLQQELDKLKLRISMMK